MPVIALGQAATRTDLKRVPSDAAHEMGNRVHQKCATEKVGDIVVPAHS